MRIYIVTDMEGISGINRPTQFQPQGGADFQEGQRLLMGDVNAAIRGAFAGGATEVIVSDGHRGGGNFLIELLDSRAILDASRSLLDESVAGLFIVGQHAMAGTLHAFWDHTQSSANWYGYCINGEPYGELGQATAYAGAFGVPLLYGSGDQAFVDELQRQFPQAIGTVVKHGISATRARCIHPEVAHALIEHDAAEAVNLAGKVEPWRLTPPIEITLQYQRTELADVAARHPNVTRVDARTVRWQIHDQRHIYWFP